MSFKKYILTRVGTKNREVKFYKDFLNKSYKNSKTCSFPQYESDQQNRYVEDIL